MQKNPGKPKSLMELNKLYIFNKEGRKTQKPMTQDYNFEFASLMYGGINIMQTTILISALIFTGGGLFATINFMAFGKITDTSRIIKLINREMKTAKKHGYERLLNIAFKKISKTCPLEKWKRTPNWVVFLFGTYLAFNARKAPGYSYKLYKRTAQKIYEEHLKHAQEH